MKTLTESFPAASWVVEVITDLTLFPVSEGMTSPGASLSDNRGRIAVSSDCRQQVTAQSAGFRNNMP